MKVVIIGSGNVATVIGRKISVSGHEIVQVAGRNTEKVDALASSLKTGYTTNLTEISTLGDIYIISVSDAAISAVASQLQLNNKLVVHTAAAVSKEVLAEASSTYGVLYPLQTLQREVVSVPVLPILVDANNEQVSERLVDFATTWADNVSVASDEERLKLHLAAVLVNNFTNHLFARADAFCSVNLLNFNLLRPIIEETILRIREFPPAEIQTGPARRRDFGTIAKHQEILQPYPEIFELYNTLTESIIKFYSKG